MNEPLSLQAVFDSMRTTVDGGVKFTFAAHEGMTETVAKLQKLRGEPLFLVVMTEEQFEANRG